MTMHGFDTVDGTTPQVVSDFCAGRRSAEDLVGAIRQSTRQVRSPALHAHALNGTLQRQRPGMAAERSDGLVSMPTNPVCEELPSC
jgi:hypothetical protein